MSINPITPLFLDAVSGSPAYGAGAFRLGLSGLVLPTSGLGSRGGILASGTPTISTLTVTIPPFRAAIQGAASTSQGTYLCAWSSASSVVADTPDGTYTRIDLVYARVWDNEVDGSGSLTADLVYLAGTPAGTPVAPTIPAGQSGVPVCYITVPKSGGGSATVSQASVPQSVAAGGTLPVWNSTDRATLTPSAGMRIYRLDTGYEEIYNGSAWVQLYPSSGVQSFSPVPYQGGVALSAANYSGSSGQYIRLGPVVTAWGTVVINQATSGGASISLPTTAAVRLFNCGSLYAFASGSSAPAGQTGAAYMDGSSARLQIVAANTAYLDVVSGTTLHYHATYQST